MFVFIPLFVSLGGGEVVMIGTNLFRNMSIETSWGGFTDHGQQTTKTYFTNKLHHTIP